LPPAFAIYSPPSPSHFLLTSPNTLFDCALQSRAIGSIGSIACPRPCCATASMVLPWPRRKPACADPRRLLSSQDTLAPCCETASTVLRDSARTSAEIVPAQNHRLLRILRRSSEAFHEMYTQRERPVAAHSKAVRAS